MHGIIGGLYYYAVSDPDQLEDLHQKSKSLLEEIGIANMQQKIEKQILEITTKRGQ